MSTRAQAGDAPENKVFSTARQRKVETLPTEMLQPAAREFTASRTEEGAAQTMLLAWVIGQLSHPCIQLQETCDHQSASNSLGSTAVANSSNGDTRSGHRADRAVAAPGAATGASRSSPPLPSQPRQMPQLAVLCVVMCPVAARRLRKPPNPRGSSCHFRRWPFLVSPFTLDVPRILEPPPRSAAEVALAAAAAAPTAA